MKVFLKIINSNAGGWSFGRAHTVKSIFLRNYIAESTAYEYGKLKQNGPHMDHPPARKLKIFREKSEEFFSLKLIPNFSFQYL